MFTVPDDVEELRRLAESDVPVLAFAFKSRRGADVELGPSTVTHVGSSLPVTEAAVSVGYDSVSAFIEMFQKILGTTPQMYFRSKPELVLK